jgi:hypothetical protein
MPPSGRERNPVRYAPLQSRKNAFSTRFDPEPSNPATIGLPAAHPSYHNAGRAGAAADAVKRITGRHFGQEHAAWQGWWERCRSPN